VCECEREELLPLALLRVPASPSLIYSQTRVGKELTPAQERGSHPGGARRGERIRASWRRTWRSS